MPCIDRPLLFVPFCPLCHSFCTHFLPRPPHPIICLWLSTSRCRVPVPLTESFASNFEFHSVPSIGLWARVPRDLCENHKQQINEPWVRPRWSTSWEDRPSHPHPHIGSSHWPQLNLFTLICGLTDLVYVSGILRTRVEQVHKTESSSSVELWLKKIPNYTDNMLKLLNCWVDPYCLLCSAWSLQNHCWVQRVNWSQTTALVVSFVQPQAYQIKIESLRTSPSLVLPMLLQGHSSGCPGKLRVIV